MKISKWDEKGNAHHFGSYDTYFPFQQEIPNKNIFYNVFLRQLDFLAKVQNYVQSQKTSVFIYHNINSGNSLKTKFSFLPLDNTFKTVTGTLQNCSFNISSIYLTQEIFSEGFTEPKKKPK